MPRVSDSDVKNKLRVPTRSVDKNGSSRTVTTQNTSEHHSTGASTYNSVSVNTGNSTSVHTGKLREPSQYDSGAKKSKGESFTT